MPDLLLELFSEEIPARMQKNAERDLAGLFREAMAKVGFADCAAATYSTPRRLALIAGYIPAVQPDTSIERKGPKIDAPEGAIQGFLKSTGLKLEQLEKRDGVYFAVIHQKGKPTAELLTLLIEGLLQNFPWPKSMRWGSGDITWVRPLHSILCIFDGKVVPVEFGGVKAGNVTYGHRFLNPEKIVINTPQEYESKLEKAHVIADRDKRKVAILKQAEAAAAARGLSIKKDDALLEEVTGLVEWPVVLIGSIDAKFMDLPPEVLTTVMRSHQKYFSMERGTWNVERENDTTRHVPRATSHALAPHFLIVANMKTTDGGKAIIAGNERVLRARFSDARFFWDQDRKKPLDEWAKGLKDVTFHAKLGSIADKVERIKALALAIYPRLERESDTAAIPARAPLGGELVARATQLCKADLVTGMVGEFAELQGIMGRYYAMQQGEAPEVADAIRDHYKPQGPNDSVPTNPVSICIALADKLDTLISMFTIGEKPTGSKDPFALRRAALGVIRIILDNGIKLNLGNMLFDAAARAKYIDGLMSEEGDIEQTILFKDGDKLKVKYIELSDRENTLVDIEEIKNKAGFLFKKYASEILSFLHDRLKVQLKDSGIRHDVITAVIADGDDDLVRIVARAKALQDFLGTEDGANLLTAYKRAANILAIEQKKDNTTYAAANLDVLLLKEPEEQGLMFLSNQRSMEKFEEAKKSEQFVECMRLLSTLRTPIDQFFDKIMVNCDDKELRANRLSMLAVIRDGMDTIANFALIEG